MSTSKHNTRCKANPKFAAQKHEFNKNVYLQKNPFELEAKPSPKETKRKRPIIKEEKEEDLQPVRKRKTANSKSTGSDKFCWICHLAETTLQCVKCPRSFHGECLATPKVINYTCVICMEEATRHISINNNRLNKALGFVLTDIKKDKDFYVLFNAADKLKLSNCIINPVDFNDIKKKIDKKEYFYTQSFLIDFLWIEHNLGILNPVSGMLTQFQKVKKKVLDSKTVIESCTKCFLQTYTGVVCEKAHLLAWGKVRGFGHWPAKIVAINKNFAFCIFFGSNDYCKVNVKETPLLSKEYPGKIPMAHKVENAVLYLNSYLEVYGKTYGPYEYRDPCKKPTKEHLEYYETIEPLSLPSNDFQQVENNMLDTSIKEESASSENDSDTDLEEDSQCDMNYKLKKNGHRYTLFDIKAPKRKPTQMKKSKPKPLCKKKEDAMANRFKLELCHVIIKKKQTLKVVKNKAANKKDYLSSTIVKQNKLSDLEEPDSPKNELNVIPTVDKSNAKDTNSKYISKNKDLTEGPDNIPCPSPTIQSDLTSIICTEPSSDSTTIIHHPYSMPAVELDPKESDSNTCPIVKVSSSTKNDINSSPISDEIISTELDICTSPIPSESETTKTDFNSIIKESNPTELLNTSPIVNEKYSAVLDINTNSICNKSNASEPVFNTSPTVSQVNLTEPEPMNSTDIQDLIRANTRVLHCGPMDPEAFRMLFKQEEEDEELSSPSTNTRQQTNDSNPLLIGLTDETSDQQTSAFQINKGPSQDRQTPFEQPRITSINSGVELPPDFEMSDSSDNDSDQDLDASSPDDNHIESDDEFKRMDFSKFRTFDTSSLKTLQEVKALAIKEKQIMIKECEEYQFELVKQMILTKHNHAMTLLQIREQIDEERNVEIDNLKKRIDRINEESSDIRRISKNVAVENNELKAIIKQMDKKMIVCCQENAAMCGSKEEFPLIKEEEDE